MLTLDRILHNMPMETLPEEWQVRDADLKKFSTHKSLYDFQEDALRAACKALWLHYGKDAPDTLAGVDTNRMGFWMATGSGKTLVIVKLIEMLGVFMARGNLPKHDIMFLVHRDHLLHQFQMHVAEYNASSPARQINLVELQDYERVKRDGTSSFFGNGINVFYHRADLFFGKSTAKKLNPDNYDNNGNWFVLLDEAHRGDASDSKLRKIHDRFARNGFLFNFSATFVDPEDKATCAYNFNLEKFIDEGYGKKIYVSGDNVSGFSQKDEFSEYDKQKIVLKTLILQTYIRQCLDKVRKHGDALYHNPLLLTIVNTVTEAGSDLRLFFSELEKIAANNIQGNLFDEAKQDLVHETRDGEYLFGGEVLAIDSQQLGRITYQDVLREVFNASSSGKIEVIRVPGNSKELVFKMVTGDAPFALIRIGDTTRWVREILQGYEMTEKFADESVFAQINSPQSPINILMGSRTFYEGWDSNRPNIVLFVNIGIGKDSKKFVMQAVGRGVRIEPIPYQRKRLESLHYNGQLADKQLYAKIKDDVGALESLFVFGTDAKNLQDVLKAMREERTGKKFDLGDAFIKNPEADKKILLVPIFEKSGTLFSDTGAKYPISKPDLHEVKHLMGCLTNKVLVAQHDCELAILGKVRDELEVMNAYAENRTVNNPELIIRRLFDYFDLKDEEFRKFDLLGEGHIMHFKKIQFIGDRAGYDELREKIEVIKDYDSLKAKADAAYRKVSPDEFASMRERLERAKKFAYDGKEVHLKRLAQHYYHPHLIPRENEAEMIRHLTHIINVSSEVRFFEKLESQADVLDSQFDWWMFSKLDETLDKIYIPYYNHKENKISKFKPDFIFWLQKGDDYRILFVDPKGGEHTAYQRKIDGYAKLFGKVGHENPFSEKKLRIKVYLRLFTDDTANAPEAYKPYWCDDIEKMVKSLA